MEKTVRKFWIRNSPMKSMGIKMELRLENSSCFRRIFRIKGNSISQQLMSILSINFMIQHTSVLTARISTKRSPHLILTSHCWLMNLSLMNMYLSWRTTKSVCLVSRNLLTRMMSWLFSAQTHLVQQPVILLLEIAFFLFPLMLFSVFQLTSKRLNSKNHSMLKTKSFPKEISTLPHSRIPEKNTPIIEHSLSQDSRRQNLLMYIFFIPSHLFKHILFG